MPRLGVDKSRLWDFKPRLGDPKTSAEVAKPRLRILKPRLWDPKTRVVVAKRRLRVPKPRIRAWGRLRFGSPGLGFG